MPTLPFFDDASKYYSTCYDTNYEKDIMNKTNIKCDPKFQTFIHAYIE